MDNEKRYVWYASYGSNLLEERFLCYVRGGMPAGTNRNYSGCADKSLPLKNRNILIHHELYFAKESDTWSNGGVAFIKINSAKWQKTYGRMYLIAEQQFTDVLKQEIDFSGELSVDFEFIKRNGNKVVKEDSWYGNVIFLGIQDGFPIFTFTFQDNTQKINKPGKEYLTTIIRGLKEAYNFSSDEIVDYLSDKKGIVENYSNSELKSYIISET